MKVVRRITKHKQLLSNTGDRKLVVESSTARARITITSGFNTLYQENVAYDVRVDRFFFSNARFSTMS